MAIRTVRLGTPREPGEGLRLGIVRRPPRGVKKAEHVSRGFYDEWFPQLAPSAKLVGWYHAQQPISDARWAKYIPMYRREMNTPERKRLMSVLARLSHQADFSLGCYCEREDRCHRSVLKELLAQHGAEVVGS